MMVSCGFTGLPLSARPRRLTPVARQLLALSRGVRVGSHTPGTARPGLVQAETAAIRGAPGPLFNIDRVPAGTVGFCLWPNCPNLATRPMRHCLPHAAILKAQGAPRGQLFED